MLTQTREDLWRAAQALTERGVTRIILTGSGTSYHGALTARAFMQRWCALPVDVCWPFMLDDETLARSGKALVVGISRRRQPLNAGGDGARPQCWSYHRLNGWRGACDYRPGGGLYPYRSLRRRNRWRENKGYHCTVLNLMLLALAVAGQQQRLDGEQRRSLLLRMEKTLTTCPR